MCSARLCEFIKGLSVMGDFLLGLAWVAIVLLPAIVASCQSVVPQDGYVEEDLAQPKSPSGRAGD
jgi:hypothetical protein